MKESDIDIIYFLKKQVEGLYSYLEVCKNDRDLFLRNDLLKDAVMMKLIAIGVYSNKLTKPFRKKYSFTEWDLIRAGRNF